MEYEINRDTLALIASPAEKTQVVENLNEYTLSKSTFSVIEHSCEYFGSSYLGRHSGTKNLIGVTHKSPIIIEETNNIIFFPTTSPRLKECTWISLNNILTYKATQDGRNTVIKFKNGKEIIVKVSVGSINNQILRASRLESVIRSRKKEKNVE